jgi:hypothetical protein
VVRGAVATSAGRGKKSAAAGRWKHALKVLHVRAEALDKRLLADDRMHHPHDGAALRAVRRGRVVVVVAVAVAAVVDRRDSSL